MQQTLANSQKPIARIETGGNGGNRGAINLRYLCLLLFKSCIDAPDDEPAAIEAVIEYIHMNPMRRGLVKRAVDWKWSSASWYLLDPPRKQLPGLPFIHGVPAGTLDR